MVSSKSYVVPIRLYNFLPTRAHYWDCTPKWSPIGEPTDVSSSF